MEKELLTKLKQYVFALYIGQEVFRYREDIPHVYELVGGHCHSDYSSSGFIQLRSLQSITDQEAIEVAKILGIKYVNNKFHRNERLINIANEQERNATIYFNGIVICSGDGRQQHFVYQYLQQQSFALPVYFKGVQYSVERLVELGIFNIKDN